ncbi:hypothetical protein LCGC14_2069060 [marine sediment metagenome]|uniref:Uncharacterized protein n=1 Tax=marine sediment metagenome TaxID=412755 RepID=A0A0F9EJ31_9ZZZZ
MFDLNKCRECLDNKCLIGISLIETNKHIINHDIEISKLEKDLQHYINMFDYIAYNKYMLSKNQLNIMNISLEQQSIINNKIRTLNNKFYS